MKYSPPFYISGVESWEERKQLRVTLGSVGCEPQPRAGVQTAGRLWVSLSPLLAALNFLLTGELSINRVRSQCLETHTHHLLLELHGQF